MKLIGLGLGIGALLLVAACSGGGGDAERLLVLGRSDITESEFRTDMQAFILSEVGAATFCARLIGLSDREVADAMVQISREAGNERLQEPDPDDEERAAGIMKEECARID